MGIKKVKELLGKKSRVYFLIAVVAGVLTGILLLGYCFRIQKILKERVPLPQIEKGVAPGKQLEKQLEELEELRKKAPSFSKKSEKEQLEELEKLRQKQKTFSEEEIKRQLEELEKLRRQ